MKLCENDYAKCLTLEGRSRRLRTSGSRNFSIRPSHRSKRVPDSRRTRAFLATQRPSDLHAHQIPRRHLPFSYVSLMPVSMARPRGSCRTGLIVGPFPSHGKYAAIQTALGDHPEHPMILRPLNMVRPHISREARQRCTKGPNTQNAPG
jgi:hypothetical protein